MINRSLLFGAIFSISLACRAQTFADLGSSGYNRSENFQMVPTTFGSAKVQVIIKASELAAAGLGNGSVISGIGYFVKTDHTLATITTDWYADLTTSSFSSTSFLTSPTFRGSSTDDGSVDNAWRKVTFSSTLVWDGTSDLLVQSCRNSPAQWDSDEVGYFDTPGWYGSISGYLYHSCTDAEGEYVTNRRPQLGVTFSGGTSTLPLSFASVNLSQQATGTTLTWKVADEEGVLSYTVERSGAGMNFHPQAVIASVNQGSYTWIDRSPERGILFYRIKSMSRSGKLLYSPVVKTNVTVGRCDLQITPNPVVGGVTVIQFSYDEEGVYTYTVFNINGQRVSGGTFQHSGGSSSHSLRLPNAQHGLYSVQIRAGGKKIAEGKIIVQ